MTKNHKKPSKWLRALLPSAIVVIWIVLAAVGGPYFGKIADESSTDLTTFLPANAESTVVNNRIQEFRDTKAIPVIIVFENGDKVLSDEDMSTIKTATEDLSEVKQVNGTVAPPVQSEDEKAAIVVLPLESDGDFKTSFNAIKNQLDNAELGIGYTLTGPASFARDLQDAFSHIDTTLLLVALGVVFIILLIVYRSPFLPLIVLFSSLAALAVAVWVVVELSRADLVQLNGQVQGILFILVIGAATDYSLLYIARYREELVEHKQSWHATWAALKSSYEPIIAAGGTVTAGLLCLLLSDLGSNKALGPVGGMGIALSILASLVLLPSLLALVGRAAFWPRIPKYLASKNEDHYVSNHPVWARVGRLVRRHPRRIWIASVTLLLVACVGVFQLRAEGVSQSQLVLGESEAVDGQKILDRHFPAGSGAPALIIADQDKQDEVVALLDRNQGVSSVAVTATGVDSGTVPVGKNLQEIQAKIRDEITKERNSQIETVKDTITEQVSSVPEPMRQTVFDQAYNSAIANIPSVEELVEKADPFKDAQAKVSNGQVMLQATMSDPADSLAARETVEGLRKEIKTVDETAKIGGTSAIQLDTNLSALRDVYVVMPAILVAITIILMLLLRAIVAPLLLLLTTVLSFGATIGISALLFNHVWGFPGADPAVIIFGFVFLVAFGIDYNIFLMTRVREETMRLNVHKGTIKGLVVTGGVITSAGIVLAATFTALSVIPILFLVQIAFIVAFGVLLDTIVVRSLLVPALTLEVGKWMWWPSKLSRKLTRKK